MRLSDNYLIVEGACIRSILLENVSCFSIRNDSNSVLAIDLSPKGDFETESSLGLLRKPIFYCEIKLSAAKCEYLGGLYFHIALLNLHFFRTKP